VLVKIFTISIHGLLLLSHELSHGLAHLGGVAHNANASGFESSDLALGVTLASSNDSTSVAHAAAGRSSLAGNEADNGQVAGVVFLEPGSSLFLGLTANLTNHYDALGLGVNNEAAEHVNEVSSVERIATNANDGGLTETLGGGLVDGLVGQST